MGTVAGSEGAVVRSLELAPDPASVRAARRAVAQVVGDRDEADVALLLVSELVTNAVLHAHSTIGLTITAVADAVRVAVRDGSDAMPVAHERGTDATTGRGLLLVEELAAAHGTQGLPGGGKCVWFSLGASAAALGPPGDDAPAPPATTTARVCLPGFPLVLWEAALVHHDAVLRELALIGPAEVDPDDLAAVQGVRSTFIAAVAEAAVAATGGEVDVEVAVDPERATRDVGLLQDVLDVAQRLAEAGQLLSPPALPEVVALRDWISEQVIAQLGAEVAPTPWRPPDTDDRRTTDEGAAADAEALAAAAGGAAVVVDDRNRIVAASPSVAEVTGWAVQELVGRRIVAIIPERYRDAHVAGFTRHLTTGEGPLVGSEVVVPVRRVDGTEVTCTLAISLARGDGGRRLYLGRLAPVPDS